MSEEKKSNKTPRNIVFVMFLLAGSVLLEGGALIFQFYKTGLLNLSVVWRPILMILMLLICFSPSKRIRRTLLKALAMLYGIVAVSDLVCFYLAVALHDW